MYKTGDVGKLLLDGTIEYIDRIDNQVKIRGNRIELNEVKYAVESLEEVNQAFITIDEDNAHLLLAYVTFERKLNVEVILNQLKTVLPRYMIPNKIISIDEFPLTNSGKVDKKNLPKPQWHFPQKDEDVMDAFEMEIASNWKKILDVENITHDCDFFYRGGTSLSGIELIANIHNQYNIEFTLNDFYMNSKFIDFVNQCKILKGLKSKEDYEIKHP